MEKIWFTSDLHLCHNREFIWKKRGFDNIDEMNKAIVHNWNSIVGPDDTVYVLGDVMLKNPEEGIELLKSLHGHIKIVLGNHDTDEREALYKTCQNVESVSLAERINYKGYRFFCTHYPCNTANLEKESLKKCILNLYGHTHQKSNFYEDIPYMYHVGVDSHNCTPVSIDDIIEEMENKVAECKEML